MSPSTVVILSFSAFILVVGVLSAALCTLLAINQDWAKDRGCIGDIRYADLITANLYAGLLAASLVCSFYSELKKYRLSICSIVVLSAFRVGQFVAAVFMKECTLQRICYLIAFVMEIVILFALPHEYFKQNPNPIAERDINKQAATEENEVPANEGEFYLIYDPSLPPPPPIQFDRSSTNITHPPRHKRLRRRTFPPSFKDSNPLLPKLTQGAAVKKIEVVCLGGIMICSILMAVLSEFLRLPEPLPCAVDNPTKSNFPFIVMYLTLGLAIFFPLVLLPVEIWKVKKAVTSGAELFACNHTHGLVFLVFIGGLIIRFVIGGMVIITTGLCYLLVYQRMNEYLRLGIDTITLIIPLGFHLYNITRSPSRSFICSTSSRMRVLGFFYGTTLHVAALGSFDSWAKGSGFVASYDFLFVTAGALSPLFVVLYQRIMHQMFHNVHLHRSLSIVAVAFTIVHIVLMSDETNRDPGKSWGWNLTSGAFAGGGLALSGVVGVLLNVRMRKYLHPTIYRFLCSLHVPFGIIGYVGMFAHRFSTFGDVEDFVFLGFTVACVILYSAFFFFNEIDTCEIDKEETVWGDTESQYSFVVSHFNKSNAVPPGSYFLVYANTGSHLSYFHARPIPVFSSRNWKLAFLVMRSSSSGRIVSFTHYLARGKPETLLLQGPFNSGTVSAFIDFVKTVHVPVDVYLCGWDSGFAKIFSILENLKEITTFTVNVRSILCVFNALPENDARCKVHKYINKLVKDWKSDIPVTIIESTTKDLQHIETLSESPPFSDKATALKFWNSISRPIVDATSSRKPLHVESSAVWLIMRDDAIYVMTENDVAHTKRGTKSLRNNVLYFCGEDFVPKQFRGWKYFAETW